MLLSRTLQLKPPTAQITTAALGTSAPPRLWLSFRHMGLSNRNHSTANAAAGFK